jgi:hypothetical protein
MQFLPVPPTHFTPFPVSLDSWRICLTVHN